MNKENVFWLLELAVKEGQLENLKSLIEEMSNSTEAEEPEALLYEWNFSDDEKMVHLYERYSDSDAAMIHLKNFTEKFAPRFMTYLEPKKFIVYGAADDRVKSALSKMGAKFMKSAGGFAR